MPVTDDKVISIKYRLTSDTGEVLDESQDEPLEYLHGHDNIVPGLEKALDGLDVGAKKKVTVQPEDAYGAYDEDLQMTAELAEFGDDVPEVGMVIELEDDDGEVVEALVTKIEKDLVHLDANDPLAGKTLHFEVEIVDIREATPDELEHGHPHGDGCEDEDLDDDEG